MWLDVPSARQSLTEDKLITYVEYLIDNKVYGHCVGISMGTDCVIGQSVPVLLQVQVHEKLDG